MDEIRGAAWKIVFYNDDNFAINTFEGMIKHPENFTTVELSIVWCKPEIMPLHKKISASCAKLSADFIQSAACR